MSALARISLILVLLLVSVSAYLRLDHSGIGCADWPECYGLIGTEANEAPSVASTYERLAEEAQRPDSRATRAHRLVASALGLAILGMALLSLRHRRGRLLSFLLLGLTVFLAWLGIHSGGLHSPAVVMGNMGGGFAMLAVLGWIVFRNGESDSYVPSAARTGTVAAVLMLCLQIALGGLTSANFAASACQTLPDCHGSYLPGRDLFTVLDLSRSHEIGPTGLAIGGAERADIQKLHRLGAVATLITTLFAGIAALRARLGSTAVAVLLLAAAEFSVGVAAILTDIPIAAAVAHNFLAALLLLALLKLMAMFRNPADSVAAA